MLLRLLLIAVLSATFAQAATSEAGPVSLVLNPSGTGAGATGRLKFKELIANGQHSVIFKAPDALAGDVIYTFPNADGTSGYVLSTNGSGALSWVANGLGSVSSVGLSMPSEFSVSGSPVTTSGTLTVSKANQSANAVFAGPTSGGAAAPAFRALVEADIGTNTVNTAAIKDANVTLVKVQNITSDRLLGRDTAGSGVPEQLTVGGGIEFTGSTGIQTSAFTGDVTKSAGGTATTIASGVVNYAQLSSANQTTLYGSRNRLRNGNMAIHQRNFGASGASAVTGTYIADGFSTDLSYSGTPTYTHDTDVPSSTDFTNQSVVPYQKFTRSIKLIGTQDASLSNEYVSIRARIEANDSVDIVGDGYNTGFILSFWVKSSVTGTFCVSFWAKSPFNRTYTSQYTISSANTWERKTVTVSSAPTAGGTWGTANETGLNVFWVTAAQGTLAGATNNTWHTTNYLATSSQTNIYSAGTANFWLTGVQLEPGTSATPFEFKPIGRELEVCQRYCWVYDASIENSSGLLASCFASGTNSANFLIKLPVRMRTKPTATFSAASHFGVLLGTSSATGSSFTYTGANDTSETIYGSLGVAGTPFTAGHGGVFYSLSSSAKITVEAELP